jgi:PAS domain S-box-containing protein
MGLANPYFGFRKDRSKTQNLWERFNAGLVQPEGLTDRYERLLVDEWRRCAQLGPDSTRKVGVRVADDELHAGLEAGRQFVSAARAAVDRVLQCLEDVPGILIIADGTGLILHVAGNNEVRVLAAERSGIVEGSRWSEALAGTNGLGTALSLRQSVHVYASEHYCEGWHTWSCAATPVIAPDGKRLSGVVDFTTIDKDFRDQALALTCSLANAIDADLRLDRQLKHNVLAQEFQRHSARYPFDALLVTDIHGESVRWNGPTAKRRFARRAKTANWDQACERIPISMPGTGEAVGTAYLLGTVRQSRLAVRLSGLVQQPARPTDADEDLREPASSIDAVELRDEDNAISRRTIDQEKLRRRPRALDEVLADYQLIFDNAIVGICYMRERVIVRCNRRFEEMFGYDAGELDNRSVAILYQSREAYEQIGYNGYKYLITHHSYSDERVMRRKDGTLFWCNVSGKTLDPKDPPRGAIWIFQDISKRKQAEEALQRANERLEQRVQERTLELRMANEDLRTEMDMRRVVEQALTASREKYRVLFNTLPIGLSITNDQGDVIEINQALSRITSQATQASLARELKVRGACVIRSDGGTITRDQLPSIQALKEGRPVHDVELGVRYSNGKVRWFNVTAAPIPVQGYGVVIAHSEITQRRRMEEQERQQRIELARVSRLNTMGEMAAALAHELGQPLSSTLNYLHGCQLRLDTQTPDLDSLKGGLSQAIAQAERAGDIVKHIRQFVRRHEPETVLTSINALIKEMVAFLDFERRQYRSRIVLSLVEPIAPLLVDPLEIKQVVLNLIKNGLEASADQPEDRRILRVSSRPVGRQWVDVEVEDRGHGIKKKDAGQIFNAFFTTKEKGMGLGLAICRSIVESHGGRLTVSSNVHGGATFVFRLPQRGE